MSGIYQRIHLLLLGAYVASLPFCIITVSPQTSLPFVLGTVWGISKLWGMVFLGQPFRLGAEGIWLGVLYLYLAGVDALVHGGSLLRPYYVSFALNCVMFSLLVDEFNKSALVREKMMQIFSVTAVLVAVLFADGVLTTQSQSGRLTFMHQNENELALNFLMAFIFGAISFARSAPKKFLLLALAYASTMLLLNALINTGTRFALYAAIMTLFLLVAAAFKTPDRRRVTLFTLSCLAFFAAKLVSFTPTLERLSPEVPGNNLVDLGGRVPLWNTAIEAFKQNPVSGLGYDGFQRFVLKHAEFFEMPHNFALAVGALGGSIGLLLLAALSCRVLYRIYRHWVQSRSFDAFIWCVPVFLTAMMLNITHIKAFWFLAAYFIAVASSTQESSTDTALGRFIRKQTRRARLLFHSIPGYLLYFYYGYGKFHITPLRYKRYCVDIIAHINKRTKRESLLDVGCGTGDVLLNAKYVTRVGLDHNTKVLDALRLRSRFYLRNRHIRTGLFRFGTDSIDGTHDVIVICNWIHNVDPATLQSHLERFFNQHLNAGGELIFDTVRAEKYPYCHDEQFLSENINAKITIVGEYTDGHLSGAGIRRVISFQKTS